MFLKKSKILSTILFFPLLYLFGWLLATPLLLIGVGEDHISLIGTIFTFSLFIFSMPRWFEIRWGLKNTWVLLGLEKIDKKSKRFLYFLRGLLYSLILLSLIIIPLISNTWGNWVGKLTPEIFLNSIVLTVGIGFAEELIFRGWLTE